LYFLIDHDPEEVYHWTDSGERETFNFMTGGKQASPFLLINVGTGVSIIRADSPIEFKRVSGSGIGGGTYYVCSF
jgi:type II pantothenate kinase